jgi:uncharacterized protein YndB with AHSA1/START domain
MVRSERLLPGPIERVWEFLTDSRHLAKWFGGGEMKYVIEPRVGGAVSLADGHLRGVVTQWKPPHLLAYSWNVFDPGAVDSRFPETYVTFELEASGNLVLLTLTHRPIGDGFESQTMMGWHTFLAMLAALLRGEEPEVREVIMERNRVKYGVERIRT